MEKSVLQVSLQSDCCKLIKNQWNEFLSPVNEGGGRYFFGKLKKMKKENPEE